jgi:3-phenylpropionate/cinnamic acid dioxygenase small subunit
VPVSEAADLRAQVERFLIEEARLLDAQAYSAWLDLFTEDAVYWIPSGADEIDPRREVSIVYDSRATLGERVWRLESGSAFAQEPRSRTCHIISNVELDAVADERVHALAALLVAEFRHGQQVVHAGRSAYDLVRRGDAWAIASKKVELINNDGFLGNLSLLL